MAAGGYARFSPMARRVCSTNQSPGLRNLVPTGIVHNNCSIQTRPGHLFSEKTDVKLMMLLVLAIATACAGRAAQRGGANAKPADAASQRQDKEADRPVGRSGIPSGYLGRTDDPERKIGHVRYHSAGDGWQVSTGPAHIVYSPGDTVKGEFIVASTFDQMEGRAASESFGLFVGGTDLDRPSQRYTLFIVRGTGEYLVKVREGAETRDIVPWTANRAIVRQRPAGRARYRLAIQVRGDSVRFLSNGTLVMSMKAGTVPTDGFAGLRVDQDVHVRVDRLRSTD